MDTSDCPDNISLSLDSYFANDKQYDPNDSIIQELFPIFNIESKDPTDEANQSKEVIKEQTNGSDTKSESESSEIESDLTPSKPIVDQVSSRIGQLKQQYTFYKEENCALQMENSELKNKISELESQISDVKEENSELNDEITELQEKLYKNTEELTNYEKEYSSKISDWFQLKMECDTVKGNSQTLQEENISLHERLEQKEAELKQFKDLVQKQITDEEEILAVKRELAEANKLLKKAEKTNQTNTERLTSKDERLRNLRINHRKVTESYKKVMAVLLECAVVLDQNRLLPRQKKRVLKNLIENMKAGNFDFEELNGDSDERSVIGNKHLESNDNTDLSLFDGSVKIKKEDISEEEIFDSSFDSKPNATNHLTSSPFETSMNLNYDVQKSNFLKSLFSPVSYKIENTSSNEDTVNDQFDVNNKISLNSKDFSNISPKLQAMYSYSMQNSDDFMSKIPYIKIFKEEERPISPVAPLLESDLQNGSAKAKTNESDEDTIIANESNNMQKALSPAEPSSDNKIEFEKDFSNVQKDILTEPLSDSQRNSLLSQKSSCSETDFTEGFESNKSKFDLAEVFEDNKSKSNLTEDFESNKSKYDYTEDFESSKSTSDLTEDLESNKSKSDHKEDFESNKSKFDKDTPIVKEFCNVQKSISLAESLYDIEKNSLLPQKSSSLEIDNFTKDFENKIDSEKDNLIIKEFSNVQKGISLAEPLSVDPGNSLLPQKSDCSEIDLTEDFESNKSKSDNDTLIVEELYKVQKGISRAEQSSVSQRNSIFPQKSSSSEIDHIEDFDNKTEGKVTDLKELLPSNFYYVGSSYSEDDSKHNIVHFGNGVVNCLVNTEKKLLVCSLHIPKQTDSKSFRHSSGVASNEERLSSVLDLYYATEKHITAVGRQILNSDSSQQFKSHFHVVFESKNEIISTACDPKKFSKSTNSSEAIQKEKIFVISKPEQELSQASDNSRLDDSNSSVVSPNKSSVQVYKIQGTDKSQGSKSFPVPIIVKTVGNYDSTDEISSSNTLEESLEENVSQKKFEEVKYPSAEDTDFIINDARLETINKEKQVTENSNVENNSSLSHNHIHTVENSSTKLKYVENKTPEKESEIKNLHNFSNMSSPSQNKSPKVKTSLNICSLIDSNHKCDFSDANSILNTEKMNPVITSVSSLQSFSPFKQNSSGTNAEFVSNHSLDNSQELSKKADTNDILSDKTMNPIITSVSSLQSFSPFKQDSSGTNAEFVGNHSLDNSQELSKKADTNDILSDKTMNPIITSVSSLQSFSPFKQDSSGTNAEFVDNHSLDNSQELQSKKAVKRQQNFSIVNPSPSKFKTTNDVEHVTDTYKSSFKKQKCINKSPSKNQANEAVHSRLSSKSALISPLKPDKSSQNFMFEKSMTNTLLQNNLDKKSTDVSVNTTLKAFTDDNITSNIFQSKKLQAKKLPKNASKVLTNPEHNDAKQKSIVNEWSIVKANELLCSSKKKRKRNKKKKSKLNELSNSVPLASSKTVQKLKTVTSKKNSDGKECSLLKKKSKKILKATKQKLEHTGVNTPIKSTKVKPLKSKSRYSMESLNIQSDSHVNTIDSEKVISQNEINLTASANKDENIILASSESLTSTILGNISKKKDNKDNYIMCKDTSVTEKQSNSNILVTSTPIKPADNTLNLNSNTSSNNLTSEQKSIVLPVSDLKTSEHSIDPAVIVRVPLKDEDTVEYSPTAEIFESNNVSATMLHLSENERIHSINSAEIFNKGKDSESKAVFENEIQNKCVNDSVENKLPLHYDESVNLQIHSPQTKIRHNSFQSNISEDEENPLIIVEDVEEKNNSDSEIMSENCVNSEIEHTESTEEKKSTSVKNKKRKKSKSPGRKKKRRTLSSNEEPVASLHPIIAALEEIRKIKIEDIQSNHSHSKLFVHKLITVLINPSYSPKTATVLFYIFDHLSSSKLNPLLSFIIKKDDSVFIPPSEHCIVEALIKVDRKKKNHLEGLLKSAITTLYYLVLEKKNICKTGLAAFCRIFTQLCKYLKNSIKPMKLCCDLVKRSHQFAPFLIANIIGVWNDLFAIKEDSKDYELLLQSSIAYGVQKKPSTLTSNDWKQCKEVFSLFLMAPAVPYPIETAKVAIDNLKNILKEMPTENDFAFIEPLEIFSAHEGGIWAWENVVKPFVLPECLKYARGTENERAFSILLELYAEIGMHVPDENVGASGVLLKFFKMKEAFSYVKPLSARFLIKLTLFKQNTLDPALVKWIEENEENLKGTSVEFCIKRQLIAGETSFTQNDIIFEL